VTLQAAGRKLEHPLLNVGGIDAAGRTHQSRQPFGKISGACPYIGDRRTFDNPKNLQGPQWRFFGFALIAVEPWRPGQAHRPRVFPAPERMNTSSLRASKQCRGSDEHD
jgi:hypothetical protein